MDLKKVWVETFEFAHDSTPFTFDIDGFEGEEIYNIEWLCCTNSLTACFMV